MIEKKDIITCKSYQPLCDYLYDYPNLDDIPPTGLVHVPLDHIDEFFKRIDSNGHRYVIVSSCSDYGIASQADNPAWKDMIKWVGMQVGPSLGYKGFQTAPRANIEKCNPTHPISVKMHAWTNATIPKIPHNVHHWFVTNLMLVPDPEYHNFLYEANTHKKLTAIPFGIAEGQQEEMHQSIIKFKSPYKYRENKIYISWNDTTLERYQLRHDLYEWNSYANLEAATINHPSQPDSYSDYLQKLGHHKYCLSPPGNGADCYRTLESIYMGCATLVQNTATNYLTKLPVYGYDSVDDIVACYNNGVQQTPEEHVNRPEIRLSHWKELMHSKRNEMF